MLNIRWKNVQTNLCQDFFIYSLSLQLVIPCNEGELKNKNKNGIMQVVGSQKNLICIPKLRCASFKWNHMNWSVKHGQSIDLTHNKSSVTLLKYTTSYSGGFWILNEEFLFNTPTKTQSRLLKYTLHKTNSLQCSEIDTIGPLFLAQCRRRLLEWSLFFNSHLDHDLKWWLHFISSLLSWNWCPLWGHE